MEQGNTMKSKGSVPVWEEEFDKKWIKVVDGVQYWILEGLNPEEVKQFIKDCIKNALKPPLPSVADNITFKKPFKFSGGSGGTIDTNGEPSLPQEEEPPLNNVARYISKGEKLFRVDANGDVTEVMVILKSLKEEK